MDELEIEALYDQITEKLIELSAVGGWTPVIWALGAVGGSSFAPLRKEIHGDYEDDYSYFDEKRALRTIERYLDNASDRQLLQISANLDTIEDYVNEYESKLASAYDLGDVSDPFGRIALHPQRAIYTGFGDDSSAKYPIEPNTDEERWFFQALRDYVHSNSHEKLEKYIPLLKGFLANGKYSDFFHPPTTDKIYRGITVFMDELQALIGRDDLPESGEIAGLTGVTVAQRRGDPLTSWSTKEWATEEFRKRSYNPDEQKYSLLLIASVAENSDRLISGPDGFYDITAFDEYDDEYEVIALGPVSIESIKWEPLSNKGSVE